MPPPLSKQEVHRVIRERMQVRRLAERRQGKLLKDGDMWHESIRAKLDGLAETTQFANFAKCGQEKIFKTCRSCRSVESFDYQCSIKWCPRCNWKITERRRSLIERWAVSVTQPKHIVLTQKNFPVLTSQKIRGLLTSLRKLRRNKIFKNVRGGCTSIEVTNEGAGWHLHTHTLCDARWVSAAELSVEWGKLTGQEFAIVKVKDVRGDEFVREVSKYVVKGNEMAGWPREQILEFVTAIKGKRFFFPFGTLYKLGKQIKAEIAAEKPPTRPCECGCTDFLFEDERQALVNEIRRETRKKNR
jgi:hypothetical protein